MLHLNGWSIPEKLTDLICNAHRTWNMVKPRACVQHSYTYLFMWWGKASLRFASPFFIAAKNIILFCHLFYTPMSMRELIFDPLFVIKSRIHLHGIRNAIGGHITSLQRKQLWLYAHALLNPDLPICLPSKWANNRTQLLYLQYGVWKYGRNYYPEYTHASVSFAIIIIKSELKKKKKRA